MAKGFLDCSKLYDRDHARAVHRGLQSAGLIHQNSTVIKGVGENAEGWTQVGYTSRVTKEDSPIEGTEQAMTIRLIYSPI